LTLALGVFGLGILVPLALRFLGDRTHTKSAVLAPVLVLVGGLLLRIVVVISVEGV
jgi:formate-dependent nitrite reductase membrane component NrfD